MACICRYYPGYTVERLMRTPFATIRILHDQMSKLRKLEL